MSTGSSLRTTCLAVTLVSGAALAIQVALTRVLSITIWHHFTYLVIGVALLGYGVAGAYLAARSGAGDAGQSDARLARRARLAALASGAAYLASTVVRCDALELFRDPSVAVGLLFLIVLSAIPFFGAGAVIASALATHRDRAGAVYAADLIGAGLGAILALPALGWLGAPRLIFAAAFAMAVAALVLALRLGRAELARALATLGLLALPLALFGEDDPWVRPAASKEIWVAAGPGGVLRAGDFRRWTPMGRIDVTREGVAPPVMGGEFGRGALMITAGRLVTQDGAAPTALYRARPDGKPLPFLRHSSTALAWVLRGVMLDDTGTARGAVGGRALVIGVGGGIDLQIALAHGASSVTGVDVNPAILSLLRDHFRDYTGGLAARPGLRLVENEGRAFIGRSGERYDVIQLSGVDTYTALSQGAYSVAEAYLYTLEAFEDYYAHLTRDGCVSFSRWALEPPRETLRLAVTAAEALRRRGAPAPERHLFVLRGREWASLVACARPLGETELSRARAFARYEGYRVLFDPARPGQNPYDRALRGSSEARAAFALAYPFQIQPSSDDAPFFFNYFKWSKLAELRRMQTERTYTSPVPIGHGIVLGSLVATSLLALLGILWPVRRLREGAGIGDGRRRLVVYFGGLGLAYLFVEVALLQRLTFLLGHPSYALTVVLAGLLASSGLGAAASRRLARASRWLRVALPAALAAAALASQLLVPRLLALGFGARLALSIALLFPLGFLMGMPFPLGLDRIRERGAGLVAWAFAVNGFFTVVAASLAIVLAMASGFSALLYIAAAIYLVALLALPARAPA